MSQSSQALSVTLAKLGAPRWCLHSTFIRHPEVPAGWFTITHLYVSPPTTPEQGHLCDKKKKKKVLSACRVIMSIGHRPWEETPLFLHHSVEIYVVSAMLNL